MSDSKLERTRDRAQRFLELHYGTQTLLLPNAWDAISAKLIERQGYPALGTTSAAINWSHGVADTRGLARDEMLSAIGRIVRAVEIPVTADLEAGFGDTPEAVAETVHQAIALGCVGCNLEDVAVASDAPLLPAEEVAQRVAAARAVADELDVAFVINARTDGFLVGGGEATLAESIERARLYVSAGARCVFVPGVRDETTIATLARAVPAPLNVQVLPDGPPRDRLTALGVARASTGSMLAKWTYKALSEIAGELASAGTPSALAGVPAHGDLDALFPGEEP